MSDQPEKIWATRLNNEGRENAWGDWDDCPQDGGTEYTRSDLVQVMVAAAYEDAAVLAIQAIKATTPDDTRAVLDAMVAKARVDALREVHQNLRTFAPHHEHNTGSEHDIGYADGYHTAMNRILALIDRTAEGEA